jgi:uncharacterized protein (TIGR00255 family)
MTGFGRAENVFEERKITIDIKSLNSKGLDLSLKMPFRYKEKEFVLRKKISDALQRGKVDVYVNIENLYSQPDAQLNPEVVQNYMQQLREISPLASEIELLQMAIRMPETVSTKANEVAAEEFVLLEQILDEALAQILNFRATEGQVLGQELQRNIAQIEANLAEIAQHDPERKATVTENLQKALKDFDSIDEARFYQELAYYLEKLDISEEKVRLTQHCHYFVEVLQQESASGKKLGFIAQEIGREINTIGSKANHHQIQKLVVGMKDELEKIKEQVLNVL